MASSMIKLKPFRQSEAMCGPAALKIVLEYYGKSYTEEELAKICQATIKKGTDHAEYIAGVDYLGFKPTAKNNATLDDIRDFIRRDVPVIVNWWSTDEGHYSVVYDMDDEYVYMMDPELDEGERKMKISEFEKYWYDFDGPNDIRVDRWMMAVEKA